VRAAFATTRIRAPLLVVLVLLAHLTLLTSFRVDGVAPDAMLLLTVAGGIAAGPAAGALLGFACGLVIDLFLQTPLGLSALVFSLTGYAVGSVQTGILRSSWWIPVFTVLVASAAGVVLYALVGGVVGQPNLVTLRLPVIAGLVGVLNAVLAPVALRLVRWALDAGDAGVAYR
jgi:rod shape-determining protein MreD